MPQTLEDILSLARSRGASDVLIVPGEPPVFRINGRLAWLEQEPFSPEESFRMLTAHLTDAQRASLEDDRELDI